VYLFMPLGSDCLRWRAVSRCPDIDITERNNPPLGHIATSNGTIRRKAVLIVVAWLRPSRGVANAPFETYAAAEYCVNRGGTRDWQNWRGGGWWVGLGI